MKKAFTLIELLLTMVILGVLGSTLMISYLHFINNAKVAKAEAEMKKISDTIIIARSLKEKHLWEITGSQCTDCSCRASDYSWSLGPLFDLPESSSCFVKWKQSLAKIYSAAGAGTSEIYLDPWGNPYLLDENESEASGWECKHDTLISVGPDGDRKEWYQVTDNIELEIPLYNMCPS